MLWFVCWYRYTTMGYSSHVIYNSLYLAHYEIVRVEADKGALFTGKNA